MNQHSNKKILFAHEVTCVMILIGMIGYTLYAITQMPQTIPIHLTKGVVDGWGSKWMSLLMPGITIFVYVVLNLFMRYQKKRGEYILFMSWLKLGCVILFAIVNIKFIRFALGY